MNDTAFPKKNTPFPPLSKNGAPSLWLAPMAGASDSAFRRIAMEEGASLSVSEMVSAKALALGDKKTPLLMRHLPTEKPFGIQLFGHNPTDFEAAAKIAERDFTPDFIDINMGCPAPKIVSSGAGSALMKTPSLAAAILMAVKNSVRIPVTAKIRSGFFEEHKNAAELALLLEEAGASLITIHGRSRERMYRPPADLEIIRQVKNAVSIPVIGNGDIRDANGYFEMLKTGCDGVMIGRGALGNPFIFRELSAAAGGTPYTPPPLSKRLALLRRQVTYMIEDKGEYIALREARKHAAWYIKGFRGAASLRGKASSLERMDDLDAFIEAALREG